MSDLAIMFPERRLQLAGGEVEMHEYTLKEQLQHRAAIKTLSTAFAAVITQDDVTIDLILDVMAVYSQDVLNLVAVSCGKSVEWVGSLAGEDAESLLLVWWGVNSAFFTRAAMRPMLEKMAKQLTTEQ